MDSVWIFMAINEACPDCAHTTKKSVIAEAKTMGEHLRFEKCGEGFTIYDKDDEKAIKDPNIYPSPDPYVGTIYRIPLIKAKRK